MKRCMKRRMAMVLAVATLMGAPGMTAWADYWIFQQEGNLEEEFGTNEYHLVTLDAQGGTFDYPLEYRGGSATATDSDASPSNALIEAGDNGKTTFAVGSDEITKDIVTDAASNAGLQSPVRDNQENDGDEWEAEPHWLKTAGNIQTEITDFMNLNKKNTTLYAYWMRKGAVTADGIGKASYDSEGGESLNLTVETLAESDQLKDAESIDKAFRDANVRCSGVEYANTIQLDINASGHQSGTPVKIILEITDTEFVRKVQEEGKQLIALHKGDGGWEVVHPEGIEWGEHTLLLTVTLRDFSPVILLLADNGNNATDKNVNVTLTDVKGVAGAVYRNSWEYTDDGEGKNILTFLPIGETVAVPYYANEPWSNRFSLGEAYGYDDEDSNEKYISGFKITEKYADGRETEDIYHTYEDYILPDAESVIITPIAEEYGSDSSDSSYKNFRIIVTPDEINKKSAFTGKVKLRYNGREAEASDWTLWNQDWEDNRGYQHSYDPDIFKNDLFEIQSDGTLTSKDELEVGDHQVLIGCKYNDEQFVYRVWIQVGVCVNYEIYLKNPAGSDGMGYTYGIYMSQEWFDAGTKKFGDITDVPEVRLFGNYESGRWFDLETGKEIQSQDVINSWLTAVAMFKKKDGSGWYIPPKSQSSNNERPTTTTTVSKGSGSGRSASGNGAYNTSSKRTYNLTGDWKHDGNGWWFQPKSGSYPSNTWGLINGSWYYFGSNGYMKTGWVQVDNKWYYLNPNTGADEGKMMTGWIFDKEYGSWFYLNKSGAMETDWVQIGSLWYYLNPASNGKKGAMASNTWIGNYYVGANGEWHKDKVK